MRILLIAIVIISSCSSPSERDLLVIDRVQTLKEGEKTDLNMEIISSVVLGYYTGEDSLYYYYEKIKGSYENALNPDSLINILDRKVKTAIGDSKTQIKETETQRDILIDFRNRKNEKLLKKIKYLFKISNAELNIEEQEQTKIFLFTLDETELMGTLE